MTIELNTGGLRKAVNEIYPSPLLLKMARERNISICFGSDAHIPAQVGHEFNMALKLAKDAGYSECVRYLKREKRSIPLHFDHIA
jgi:histidinol-phosphatase (PHP family)